VKDGIDGFFKRRTPASLAAVDAREWGGPQMRLHADRAMDNAQISFNGPPERPESHQNSVELHSASHKGQLSFHPHFFFFNFMYRDVEYVSWSSF